jgi:PAS domain S-box-containing protein
MEVPPNISDKARKRGLAPTSRSAAVAREIARDVPLGSSQLKSLKLIDRDSAEHLMRQRMNSAQFSRDSAIHNVPCAVYVIGLEKRNLLFLNDFGARMFGYAPGDFPVSGNRWQNHFWGVEESATIEAHFLFVKTLRDGETSEMINRVTRRDGEIIWVRFISSVCERDDQGNAVSSCGFAVPMRSCDLRPNSVANYMDGLTNRPEAVACWELDLKALRLTHVSDEVELLTGYNSEEWTKGALWETVIDRADRERLAQSIRSVVASRRGIELEFRIQKRDQTTTWVRLNCCCKGGAVLFGTVTDISAQHEMEEEAGKAGVQSSMLNNRLIMALEEQQHQLAQYLHDDIGQNATAVLMDLCLIEEEAAKLTDAEGGKLILEGIHQIRQNAAGILDSVRGKARELFPAALEEGDLLAAVEWQLAVFKVRTGIDCSFETNLKPPFPFGTDVTLALFRILQEILTNTWKHSKASSLKVSLMGSKLEIEMRVKDNGIGMPKPAKGGAVPYGVGMLSMLERARAIGAELNVNTAPGEGVELIITVPVPSLSENQTSSS